MIGCRGCGGDWFDPDDPRPLVHAEVTAAGLRVVCARCGRTAAAVVLDDLAAALGERTQLPSPDPSSFRWSSGACVAAGYVAGLPGLRWRAVPWLRPDQMFLSTP